MSEYKIINGNVVRQSDGKVVAPCNSADDPDFLAYNAWVNAGNQPEMVETIAPALEVITINRAEMLIALRRAGLTQAMRTAIENLPDEYKEDVRIAFDEAPYIDSDNATVAMLLSAIGLDAQQRLALFKSAKGIL